MGSEKAFESRIRAWLATNGFWSVKYFANRNTKSGIPDVLCCINGVFVAIEVKAERGKPSALQIYQCKRITESGGVAVIVWPNDFDRLKEFLTIIGERKAVPRNDFLFESIYLHPMS